MIINRQGRKKGEFLKVVNHEKSLSGLVYISLLVSILIRAFIKIVKSKSEITFKLIV